MQLAMNDYQLQLRRTVCGAIRSDIAPTCDANDRHDRTLTVFGRFERTMSANACRACLRG
jgi:hypothetical protein